MRRLILLTVVAVLFCLTSGAQPISAQGGDTFHVPADFPTIQDAINAASSGDTIIVADGTYTGTGNINLDFGGKDIILQSENGPQNCIIDIQGTFQNQGRGFYFHSGETSDAIVAGFTIRNAFKQNGPGIYIRESSPTIRNCVIEDNYSYNWGYGGGVYVSNYSSPTFENCIIRNNETHGWTKGCGLYIWYHCDVTMTNCLITGNTGASSYGAGGIHSGMYCNVELYNCTIADNTGYGIYSFNNWYYPGNFVYLYNSIIWGHTKDIYAHTSAKGYVELYNCDYAINYGGTPVNCISDDPLFIGDGDYHLQESSPCIDTGDNTLVPAGVTTDLDGNSRISGYAVDMGPYELQLGLTYVSETVEPNNVRPDTTKAFSAEGRNQTGEAITLTTQTLFKFDDSSEGGAHVFEANLAWEVTIPAGEVAKLTFEEAQINTDFLFGSYYPVIEATDGVDFYEVLVTDTITVVPDLLIVDASNSPYQMRGDCDFLDVWVKDDGEVDMYGSPQNITTRNVTLDGNILPRQLASPTINGANLTIGGNGFIDAKGKGYEAREGPGPGTDGEAFKCGGGGGASSLDDGEDAPGAFENKGRGGEKYGRPGASISMGSGGGAVVGVLSSEGGGFISIILTGKLTNHGVIDVSGNDGYGEIAFDAGSGGGGAGVIYISANQVEATLKNFKGVGGKGGGKPGTGGDVVPHVGGDGGDGGLIIDCEPSDVSVTPESFDFGEGGIVVGAIDVDLDVDSNMDGSITADDDRMEMQEKAIIINVNNNDSDGDDTWDHLDNNINGGEIAQGELTQLILRKTTVPQNGKVVLKATSKEWLRIFDQDNQARIGPADAGGPNADEYEVPDITTGPLTYHIECINHGNVTISLIKYDGADKELGRDSLKVVLNVDKKPGPLGPSSAMRFYVRALKSRDHLMGVQVTVETPPVKVNWAPTTRTESRTNVTVIASKTDLSMWIETGLMNWRPSGTGIQAEERIYFFVKVPGGPNIWEFDVRRWPRRGTYKVEIADRDIGFIKCYLNGQVWASQTVPAYEDEEMEFYQIGSELLHSVDQNPGKSESDVCVISEAKILLYNQFEYQPTELSADDVRIVDRNKMGGELWRTTSHEWAYSHVTATGFKMWDKVVEY